jgi:RNA-directed DNA polymerase
MQDDGNVKSETTKHKPVTVPFAAKQAGEVQGQFAFGEENTRWAWTESSVWTDRMLTALENGVKGGKWFSLIDKVFSPANLRSAFNEVARNDGAAGVDHVTIDMFKEQLDHQIECTSRALQTGEYEPQAVRRTMIPKPGSNEKRPLGIPTVRDRVVQNAIRHVLEPIFERDFAEHSYGFRPGRGCHDALRRVEQLLAAGYTHVVDADLKGYFDTIDHDILMERLETKIADGKVLGLIRKLLAQEVLEDLNYWTPEKGSPQGSVLSPLLSNIYLDPLDHLLQEHGFEMVRYADDFVVLCRSREEAEAALELIRTWTTEVRLTLHPTKTQVVDTAQGGFDFLGYHFERGYRWPRKKSLQKFKDTLRQKTRRSRGNSLQAIIADVNQTLEGWFGYFQYSHWTTFPRLDKWIRMRLRSILRKQQKKRGRGRGSDHQRWPIAFFQDRGLFSLVATHASLCQSTSW